MYPENDNKKIIQRIKSILKSRRIYQKELAVAIGVTEESLSKNFKTGKIQLETIVKIGKYLKIDLLRPNGETITEEPNIEYSVKNEIAELNRIIGMRDYEIHILKDKIRQLEKKLSETE